MKIDAFVITQNEEELLPYCLESFASLGEHLGILSVVDNNSTDATLDIIESWRDRLPIVLQHHRADNHHGRMRTMALEPLTAEWVFYLDADETMTSNMAEWLSSSQAEQSTIWEFFKYTTILDRYHYVEGGNGPTQRLFRRAGAYFPQDIHTEPTGPGLSIKRMAEGVILFDHTACKSQAALWAKGWRYQWAVGVPGIGPPHEYVGRVADALINHPDRNVAFPESIKRLIFTGP